MSRKYEIIENHTPYHHALKDKDGIQYYSDPKERMEDFLERIGASIERIYGSKPEFILKGVTIIETIKN